MKRVGAGNERRNRNMSGYETKSTLSQSLLAKGAFLSFVLTEYRRGQKEIGPKCSCIVQPVTVKLSFVFSF